MARSCFPSPADFNNDGKLDLAVTNCQSDSVSVLLGKGDGSFQAPLNSTGGAAGSLGYGSLAYSDFNHDGNLDLAVAYQERRRSPSCWATGTARFGLLRITSPAMPRRSLA